MSSNQQFESFALRASSQEGRREFALLFFRAFRVQSGTDIGWTKSFEIGKSRGESGTDIGWTKSFEIGKSRDESGTDIGSTALSSIAKNVR
ncbi:MAG: hypothetical protein BWY75_02041 [bacterium ADurb.Bin425]|nr:MAG: hypothetical protein BWY75_02041 [bacterium ADurb.Bin425]